MVISKYAKLAPTQWEKFMIPMKEDPVIINGDRVKRDSEFSQDVADGSIFFDRQLEHIDARMFEVKFAPLKVRQLVPVKSDAGWASFEVYQILESYGVPARITDYSTDIPSAEVDGREVSQRIHSWAIKYQYNIREYSRARELGIDLDAAKGIRAYRAVERQLDALGALGDSAAGIEGIINNSLITPANVPNGAGGTPGWTTKTADEIILDVTDMINDMRSGSSELFTANQVLIPTAQYDYIRALPRSTVSDTTVLGFLKREYPEVAFESWARLTGQGAAATDRMIAMDRNPENAEFSIPIEPMRLDPQFKSLTTEIPLLTATAGILLRQPLSVIYRDAI